MAKKKKQIKIEKKKDKPIIIIFIIVVLGFIIYANTFSSPFVLDDRESIIENRDLRYNSIFLDFNMLRYVGYVTFALNNRINGLNTFGYHLVNVIIHIVNALLVYILFRMIFSYLQDEKEDAHHHLVSAFIALIFLVHPIQTQAVTYIVQRLTSLAAMFSLLAILFYLKFRISSSLQYRYYIFSLIAGLLAFKTKENTAMLPFVILLMEIVILKRSPLAWKKKIIYIIPFFVLVAAIPLSFMNLDKPIIDNLGDILSDLKEKSYETPTISRSQYLFTQFRVIITYFRLLLIPVHQSIHYHYPLSQSFFELRTIFSFCVLAAIIAIAIVMMKRYTGISFGIFWFFLFLFVESSIIPIQDPIFEHRLYLPSIGFISAIVLFLFMVTKKINSKAFVPVMVLLVILLSVKTFTRNEIWKDEVSIWKDASSKYPRDEFAHAALGTAYIDRAMYDAGIEELKKALAINPKFVKAYGNLAYAYAQKGLTDQAISEYNTAIKLAPDYLKGYYSLATLYFKNAKLDEAYALLQKAHKLDPLQANVNAQIGIIYCVRGDFKTALDYFNNAVRVDPEGAEINYNYGICLLRNQQTKEARERFFKALEINPDSSQIIYFIAASYDNENDLKNAVSYYQQFLSHAPPNSAFAQRAQQRLTQLQK